MATSTIFANVRIQDIQEVETFINALEDSERAVKARGDEPQPKMTILRDHEEIRKLVSRRHNS